MKILKQVLSFSVKQFICQNLKGSPLQVKKSVFFTNVVNIIYNAKPYPINLPTCTYQTIILALLV